MGKENVTYEAKLILEAINEFDERFGTTLGKYNIINHVKGLKYKARYSMDEISSLIYYDCLKELSKSYLNFLIDDLYKNNYLAKVHLGKIKVSDKFSYDKDVYIIGDAGRDALTNNKEIYRETDHLYDKKYMFPGILQYDPTLYQLLFDYCGYSRLSTSLAIYMPESIKEINKYIIEYVDKSDRESLEAEKLQLILHTYLSKNEPQYKKLAYKDITEATTLEKVVFSNLDKVVIKDDISINMLINKIFTQLGIDSDINQKQYIKSKLEKTIIEIISPSISVDLVNNILKKEY